MRAPGVVACVTNWLRIGANGRIVFFKNQKATRLCLASLVVSRRAFEAVGPFRSASVGADWELYCALRARFGAASIGRLEAPWVWGLWSAGSATRTAGTESLEDGYRSPARRDYSQLVFEQSTSGASPPPLDVDARLQRMGNDLNATEIVEVSQTVS